MKNILVAAVLLSVSTVASADVVVTYETLPGGATKVVIKEKKCFSGGAVVSCEKQKKRF